MKILPEIRLKVVKSVLDGQKSVSQLSKETKIARKTIYFWLKKYSVSTGRKRKVCLNDNYVKGRAHPKFKRHLFQEKIIRLIKKNPRSSIREMSKVLNASTHCVFNILKALDLTTESSRIGFCKLYAFPGVLAEDIKVSVVRSAMNEGNIAKLSREYLVARKTIYKWISEYKSNGKVGTHYVMGENHHRAYSQARVNLILAEVVRNPEKSIRQIAASLNFGNHGVYSALKRMGLTHSEERIAYANNCRRTAPAPAYSSEPVKSFLSWFSPNQMPAPPPGMSPVLKAFAASFVTTSLISSFVVIWWKLVFSQVDDPFQFAGLIFATLAIFVGSVFFLYLLKYYISLGIVLSFSNKENEEIYTKTTFKDLLARVLGSQKAISSKNSKVFGLMPNLDGITLKDKPFISIQIPFYNEKNVVRRAIEAAVNFKYPSYEIILADDSTDETSEIIRKYQEGCLFKYEKLNIIKGDGYTFTQVEVRPGVVLKHIHRTTRTGFKGAALDLALKLTNPKTKYVAVFDADFVPYPDTLDQFLKYFQLAEGDIGNSNGTGEFTSDPMRAADSRIAAVQGYQWHVLNKSENWITRGVRSEYAGSYVIERSGAEIYGGLKQISGSVYMIKKDVLSEVGWGTSITEDFELTLKMYEKGYKVLYTPYIQAPSECVSTVKRLVRQRMRWAEGHSFNIKKMFIRLMVGSWKESLDGKRNFIPSRLTLAEKLELLYLAPYYLQALFFLVGTFAWLISETVFQVRLPFWTAVWGWSLVLTNMIALPLLNAVGLFVEEAGEKDYVGLGSFLLLSYLLVPFQAYASIKGFLEKEEGTWFRTPKTGRITDILSKTSFFRFISDFLPAKQDHMEENYLAISTSNNVFNSFGIKPRRGKGWLGKAVLAVLLAISTTITSFAGTIETLAPKDAMAFSVAGGQGTKEDTIPDDYLALNTDKFTYKPGETAKISMAVIDYKGETVCDADVKVTITDPSGRQSVMQNSDRSIKVNQKSCADKKYATVDPDYEARYMVGGEGVYKIRMDSSRFGETYTATGEFQVRENIDFEITRKTASRIYPKNVYPMIIKIKANKDYKGRVTEIAPLNFDVFENKDTKDINRYQNGSQQVIWWDVNWTKGGEYILNYYYDTPDKSPDLYEIGPLNVGGFIEGRSWSLAIDASGSGTNTVSPTTAAVSAADGTYTFTYDPSESFTHGGEIRIKVPNSSGWSTPQGTAGTAGYTTASITGTGKIADLVITSDATTEGNWTLTEDDTDACNTANPAVDTGTFVEGTGSIKCGNSGSAATEIPTHFLLTIPVP